MNFTSFFLKRLAVALAGVFCLPTLPLLAAPALSVQEATKIAQGILESKGVARETYIESVQLQPTALVAGTVVWYVEWSSAIPTSKEGKKASGVEISMNGDVVYVVTGRGKGKHTSPH